MPRDIDWKKDVPWYDAARDADGMPVSIDHLPRDDRFTKELVKLREESIHFLWRQQ